MAKIVEKPKVSRRSPGAAKPISRNKKEDASKNKHSKTFKMMAIVVAVAFAGGVVALGLASLSNRSALLPPTQSTATTTSTIAPLISVASTSANTPQPSK